MGFQLLQSLISFGSGGVAGVGLGQSEQKMFFLPAAHTDFIFSVIGEEFGLLGACAVIGLFLVVGARGLRIAARHPDPFASLLASAPFLSCCRGPQHRVCSAACRQGLALPRSSRTRVARMMISPGGGRCGRSPARLDADAARPRWLAVASPLAGTGAPLSRHRARRRPARRGAHRSSTAARGTGGAGGGLPPAHPRRAGVAGGSAGRARHGAPPSACRGAGVGTSPRPGLSGRRYASGRHGGGGALGGRPSALLEQEGTVLGWRAGLGRPPLRIPPSSPRRRPSRRGGRSYRPLQARSRAAPAAHPAPDCSPSVQRAHALNDAPERLSGWGALAAPAHPPQTGRPRRLGGGGRSHSASRRAPSSRHGSAYAAPTSCPAGGHELRRDHRARPSGDLVPYRTRPTHQRHNAEALVRAGASTTTSTASSPARRSSTHSIRCSPTSPRARVWRPRPAPPVVPTPPSASPTSAKRWRGAQALEEARPLL